MFVKYLAHRVFDFCAQAKEVGAGAAWYRNCFARNMFCRLPCHAPAFPGSPIAIGWKHLSALFYTARGWACPVFGFML
jgi:hypothetical protein